MKSSLCSFFSSKEHGKNSDPVLLPIKKVPSSGTFFCFKFSSQSLQKLITVSSHLLVIVLTIEGGTLSINIFLFHTRRYEFVPASFHFRELFSIYYKKTPHILWLSFHIHMRCFYFCLFCRCNVVTDGLPDTAVLKSQLPFCYTGKSVFRDQFYFLGNRSSILQPDLISSSV